MNRSFPMLAFLLLLSELPGMAQPKPLFVPQPASRVPGLVEYAVTVCNSGGSSLTVLGTDVVAAALHQGIFPATYSNLMAYVAETNRRSPWRYVGLGLEVGTWGMSTLVAIERRDENGQVSGPIKIRERLKALFPIAGATLTFSRMMFDRERKDVTLPSNVMPPMFQVLAGNCAEYAIFSGAAGKPQ